MIYKEKQSNHPPLFHAVGCICLCESHILLLKRLEDKSYPKHWGIPTGKVDSNEDILSAMIRELFEETGILLSSQNLSFIRDYHVINEDMSFIYSVFHSTFNSIPQIKICHAEHSDFGWYKIDEIRELKLVPDLNECLEDTLTFFTEVPNQLQLFPEMDTKFPHQPSISILENELYEDQAIPNTSTLYNKGIDKLYYVSFGPTAAGKTTGLTAMAKADPSLHFAFDTSILRKKSRLNYYLHSAFEKKIRAFFFHFQIEVLHLRYRLTQNAPTNSLIDETIYSTLAYTKALYRLDWITANEFQTFFCHYSYYLSNLPEPKIVFYFDCAVETLMKRIKQRGRKHELLYPRNYLEALRFSFSEVSNELSRYYNVIQIDTDKNSVNKLVRRYGPKKTA